MKAEEDPVSTPEFQIAIGSDGKVKVKVSGASGEECMKLTDMLRDIVGREESREKTPEFYGPGGSVRMNDSLRGRTTG